MRMYSRIFNTTSELEKFVNAEGIKKDQIVGMFKAENGYCLNYYAE